MICVRRFLLFKPENNLYKEIYMPEDSTILACKIWKDGYIYLWSLVDLEKPFMYRYFKVFATDAEMIGYDDIGLHHKKWKHISTVLEKKTKKLKSWHVFEVF